MTQKTIPQAVKEAFDYYVSSSLGCKVMRYELVDRVLFALDCVNSYDARSNVDDYIDHEVTCGRLVKNPSGRGSAYAWLSRPSESKPMLDLTGAVYKFWLQDEKASWKCWDSCRLYVQGYHSALNPTKEEVDACLLGEVQAGRMQFRMAVGMVDEIRPSASKSEDKDMSKQQSVYSSAAEGIHTRRNAALDTLAHEYLVMARKLADQRSGNASSASLAEQYEEGLITADEFLNKLIDELVFFHGKK
jgi:hypothetical protein